MSNNQPSTTQPQRQQPQTIDAPRRRRKQQEPQVPSIRAAIFGQWLNGASVSILADRYGCGESFILAVCRSEAQRMRDERRKAA